jgi:fatty acid desaturase
LVLYVPLAFLIAGRQGALLNLMHDGAHGLLSPSRRLNRALSIWALGAPIGVLFEGYRDGHLRHHLSAGTDRDPLADQEKYRVTDLTSAALYLALLRDLLGITALRVFFAYEENEGGSTQIPLRRKVLRLGIAQSAVFLLLFWGDLRGYVLFWCLPAMSAHMFLMRLRGIAEHGLARQLGVSLSSVAGGIFYTRSFLTPARPYPWLPLVWLEKVLIGSISVHYHHEHHLFPTVPFYNLAELHRRLAPEVARRHPEVYASGYLSAVLRALPATRPVASTELA